jgi:hypothetical protein
MRSLEAKSAACPAQESRNDADVTRLPLRVDSSVRISRLRTKKRHTHPMRGAAVGARHLTAGIGGVDTVHTFGFGLGRTSVGLGRITYVSGGVQCLQGLESGSSPTLGTFSHVRGPFWAFDVVDSVNT